MSKNVLAAVGAGLLVLLALPATSEARSESRSSTAMNPASVLNGVYRVSFTEKELLAGGAKPGYARYQTGVATLTLRDGRYVFLERNRLAIPGGCRGPYNVRGKRIFADLNVKGCHGTLRAAWALRNGWLRFSDIVVEESGDPVFWESKPWKKIG